MNFVFEEGEVESMDVHYSNNALERTRGNLIFFIKKHAGIYFSILK
jgi:hypothetical protein